LAFSRFPFGARGTDAEPSDPCRTGDDAAHVDWTPTIKVCANSPLGCNKPQNP